MEIRAASIDDDVPLKALDAATWSPIVTPGPQPSPETPFFRPDDDPANYYLVAVLDGAVAGYVKLGPPTPLESNKHVVTIKGLAVDPARQRQGIARALIEAAAEEASKRGARRLTLRVLGPNTGAQVLYESCGFEVEGTQREEFFLDGRYVDDVLMARRLN
jgi:ribosomal protein S18 acetylase RimI-like enzyme